MAFFAHQRDLWRMGIYWRLLWLTIRHPRTPKHCWITPKGYEVRSNPLDGTRLWDNS